MVYRLGVLAVIAGCLSATLALPPWERTKREEPPLCTCPANIDPVCGSDDKTYSNICLLECEKERSGVEVAHEGQCRTESDPPCCKRYDGPVCQCTTEFRPVCSNNGLTYANPCMLNCEKDYSKGLDISHEGECDAKPVNIEETGPTDALCNCPKDRELVCASNGLTYVNECLMKCDKEDLSIAHGGPCYN